jgi:hypothetical protein
MNSKIATAGNLNPSIRLTFLISTSATGTRRTHTVPRSGTQGSTPLLRFPALILSEIIGRHGAYALYHAARAACQEPGRSLENQDDAGGKEQQATQGKDNRHDCEPL